MPREGYRFSSWSIRSLSTHFNPHAPRGARRCDAIKQCRELIISIHVPREGHDFDYAGYFSGKRISIHVPREGHDSSFQKSSPRFAHFNPRAPRGARPLCIYITSRAPSDFNPRAPRGARRSTPLKAASSWSRFQSTCPARGTTL